MVRILLALAWLACALSAADAGGVTTTSIGTTTTSSTSTSLPPREVCDNCLDDDLNGLVDLDDPACCATSSPTLALRRLRLRAVGTVGQVALDASSLPAVPSLAPPTHTVLVQLAPDDAPPTLCAAVHAAHFRSTRDAARFTDRTTGVPGASGIQSIRLERLGTGSLRLRLRGARARFAMPADTTRVRVTVGLRALAAPGAPARCVTRTVDVVPGARGGLELP